MAPTRPQDVNPHFIRAMNAGDLEDAMAIWVPETVFVPAPGEQPVTGMADLRTTLQAFVDLEPHLEFQTLQFVQSGDVAFESLRWTLRGRGPDGSPVRMTAIDGNVLRRRPDGTWVTVIDNPFHSHHINDGGDEAALQRLDGASAAS